MRGGKEHRDLCWGDVQLTEDENGCQYLDYTERQTKTRTGENPRDVRPIKPGMYENPNKDRCPVQLYKEFAERRPTDCNTAESPFYIALNNVKERNETKHRRGLRKQLLDRTNYTGWWQTDLTNKENITNHSARKTMIQKLNDNDVPPNHIMQISGHKNVQSINNCSSLNSRQLQTISTIISTESQSREISVQQMPRSELVAGPSYSNCPSSLAAGNSNLSSIFFDLNHFWGQHY